MVLYISSEADFKDLTTHTFTRIYFTTGAGVAVSKNNLLVDYLQLGSVTLQDYLYK